MPDEIDITQMLDDVRGGDADAWDRLVALVYSDLKQIAHRQVAGQAAERTLNTTGLVHECYLRIMKGGSTPNDRQHFFALASRVMRQVIIDHARERLAAKRGGGEHAIPLEEVSAEEVAQARQFVALDDALAELAKIDERQARVVECRFFAGLSEQETAEALGVSLRLVQREWAAAREWLARFLES